MMNCVLLLLQATGLLLVLGGDEASAAFVEGANLDSDRDLVGFNDIMDIHSTRNRVPSMYPSAAAPTPYPVEVFPATETEGRLNPPIEEDSTTVAPSRLVSGSPTSFPSTTQTQDRLDPSIEEVLTIVTQDQLVSNSPTSPPSEEEPIVPGAPTKFPTKPPTPFPTRATPSEAPSSVPSDFPSLMPSMSLSPTAPTASPSMEPTQEPTDTPITSEPTSAPTPAPSFKPSEAPSIVPSDEPSNLPNASPSEEPSEYISDEPSAEPSTDEPSGTSFPSDEPTATAEPSDIIFGVPNVRNDINERNTTDGQDSMQSPASSLGSISTVPSSTSFSRSESQIIPEIICDIDNASLWGTLCLLLREAKLFEILGNIEGQYTLFAPTNEAFDNSDYMLESLLQDESALRSLMSMHIAPLILPYEALLCNLNTEMLNFDITYTLCIGDMKVQTADGNEIRNLPIIDEPGDIKAMNGIIHMVNNLILPFQFLIDNDTTDGIWNASDILSDNFEERDIDDVNADADGIWNASDILSDDFEESDIDGVNANVTTRSDTASLASAMDSVSEFIANRQGLVHFDEHECKVCESQNLCTISDSTVVLFPGEGDVHCINVLTRQNKGNGIIMQTSMCEALQQRFKESCLIGDGEI